VNLIEVREHCERDTPQNGSDNCSSVVMFLVYLRLLG